MMRLVKLIFALPLLVALSQPAAAQGLSKAQEQAVDKLISDYFIRNPDKLEQALSAYQNYMQEQERLRFEQTLKDSAKDLYRNKLDFSMGPADAPITIVEFFDYNCGYCKRAFAPLMEVMQENDDVRLVFKEFPILSEDSERAAKVALAVDDKLQFLTFHTKLMTHRGPINNALLDKTIADMKLNKAAIDKQADSDVIMAHIEANRSLARDLGLTGTPAFIINDAVYPGALDKPRLDEAIALARSELKKNK
ncbi:MAG: DsbA family protein [Parvibaculales bacterium]